MIVYKHTSTITGKCYIGKTCHTLIYRWKGHIYDAKYNKHRKFLAAINELGSENWLHEVLFESDDPVLIADKEVEFIAYYDSVNSGYNTIKTKTRQGTNNTPESLERMSIAQKTAHARKHSEGTSGGWHRKDGGAMLGKKHPNKGGESANKGKKLGKTWEEIFGVEGAASRRAAHKNRRLNKE
jgi:hypothetical protein